jgi:hypothetical protein
MQHCSAISADFTLVNSLSLPIGLPIGLYSVVAD